MKMIYNGAPVKSLNVHHFEISTQDCDMIASDLQAGKTAVARGKKIVGTGKSFSFAAYGELKTNSTMPIPTMINVIVVTSTENPLQLSKKVQDFTDVNFGTEQVIGNIFADGVSYPVSLKVIDNLLMFSCEKIANIQIFLGKDEYV